MFDQLSFHWVLYCNQKSRSREKCFWESVQFTSDSESKNDRLLENSSYDLHWNPFSNKSLWFVYE